MAVIVIDPGHGGTRMVGGSSHNNATGPAGTKEKALTLAIGMAARAALTERDHTVFMTRSTDANLGLATRAHVARDHRAAAFVSIHLNASDAHRAQGTETWLHTRHSLRSQRLAQYVQTRVRAVTQLRDRKVQAKGLGVLAPNAHFRDTACCLVEVSFLDRADEEQRLLKPDYQNAIANAIADSVTDYLTSAPASSETPEAVGRDPYLEDANAAAAVETHPPRPHPSRRATKRTKAKGAAKPCKRAGAKSRPTIQSTKRRGAKSAMRLRQRRL